MSNVPTQSMAHVFHAAHPHVFGHPPPAVQQPVQGLGGAPTATAGGGPVNPVPAAAPPMGAVGGAPTPSTNGMNFASAAAGTNAVGNGAPHVNLSGLNLAGIAGIDMSALSTEGGFEKFYWNKWTGVSQEMGRFGEGLKAMCARPDARPEDLQQLSQYTQVEKGLGAMADMQLLCFRLFDQLLPSHQNTTDIVQKNVYGGNITVTLDQSDRYTGVCDELVETETLTKVIDLDFETPLISKEEITKKAKEKIGKNKGLQNHLKKCKRVEPVARETKPHKEKKGTDGQAMNTVPIKLYSKSRQDKVNLDKALKKAGFITAFHWPRDIVKPMQAVREAYQKLKTREFDLTDKYLLLRPNTVHGRSINVFFRTKEDKSEFQYLESIRTPASYELCQNLNYQQPTVSKYVTFNWGK